VQEGDPGTGAGTPPYKVPYKA